MPPSAFIAMLLPAAQRVHREHGIPASFTIAQAALESGWGARAPGNNLFGIKSNKAWKGKTIDLVTHEVIKGERVRIVDQFRAYTTIDDCIADRVNFFRVNRQYAACFKETTGAGWARAVATAGYATDPSYAKILLDIMRTRNLAVYDQPAAQVTA